MIWEHRFALALSLALSLVPAIIVGCDDASSEAANTDEATRGQSTGEPAPVQAPESLTDESGARAEAGGSDNHPVPPAASSPSFNEASAESAPRTLDGECRATESVTLGASGARRPTIVLSQTPNGYAVAWATDERNVQLARLNADGSLLGTAHAIEVPGAMDIRELVRLGSGFVLVGQTMCPDTRHPSFKCLVLTSLDENLRARAAPLVHETIEWSEILVRAVDERTFVVLRSHTYLPPVLERFQVDAQGVIAREQLGDLSHGARRGEVEPPSVEGLAVRQAGERTQVAALLRVNNENGSARFLHLVGAEPVRVQSRLLAEGVKDMRFASADTLQLVAGASPRIVVIGLDGSVRQGPSRIEDTAYGAVRMRTSGERQRLTLGRFDDAGRQAGSEVAGLPVVRHAAVAGEGTRFLFVGAEGRSPRNIVARPIACDE